MSADIVKEVDFLLRSLILGVSITFVYDILRIVRRIIRHNIFFISLEDVLYWMCCSVIIFQMLYEENNGIVRWFVIMGAALGMILYKATISRFFVKTVSTAIGKTLDIIFMPFRKIWRFLKKKLTSLLKMFRMILCKR